MCDSCGLVFSENDDGWTTLTGTMQLKNENGKRYTKEVVQDKCIACTASALAETTIPRTALPAPSRTELLYERQNDSKAVD